MKVTAESGPQNILVVEDHPLFCEALRMALQGNLHAERVETASTLAEALQLLSSGYDTDLLLLDLNLPDVSGVDGLLRLKAASPRVPVVVVSALSDDRVIANVLSAGAAGFVPKDTPKDELLRAVRVVLDGGVYTPEKYSEPTRADDSAEGVGDAVKRLAELTPQQLRILELICEGQLNKQIAYELSIAETTVKAHVTAILRKLRVHSRTQAVLVAHEARYSEILNQ